MGCCLLCPTHDGLLSLFCDKMLSKASCWSLTVSGSSYWILAKSKFLTLVLLEGLMMLSGTCKLILGIQCLLLTVDHLTQFELQQKCTPFPRLQVSGITVLLFWKHVAFVNKQSHTRTRALHTANKYPVALTELWKQGSHKTLEVVFECIYLQLTVNGIAFMSGIVCC